MTNNVNVPETRRVLTAKGVSRGLQDRFIAQVINRHSSIDTLVAGDVEVGYWEDGEDYSLSVDDDESIGDEREYYCKLSIEVDDESSVNDFCTRLQRAEQRLRGEFHSVESAHVSFDEDELTICVMGVTLPDLRKYAIFSGFTSWLSRQQSRLTDLQEQRAALQTLTNQAEELAALLEEN